MKKIIFAILGIAIIANSAFAFDTTKYSKKHINVRKIEKISNKKSTLEAYKDLTVESEGTTFLVDMERYLTKKKTLHKEILRYRYTENDTVVDVVRTYYFNKDNILIKATSEDYFNNKEAVGKTTVYFINYKYPVIYIDGIKREFSSNTVFVMTQEMKFDLYLLNDSLSNGLK